MDAIKQIVKKVRHTIVRHNMIIRGDRVIVAVSGGPDSVCLLDILALLRTELVIELVVAHFNHGLRPDEDEAETKFVKSLTASLKLPFETKRTDGSLARGAASQEERARLARYQFLEEVKGKFSAARIAVGHNLNDQAETVLMRLLRGSGASGLSGIPPCRDGKIIRPLIEISRGEIEYYLEQKGLTHVTDSSNLQTRYLRNRIRMELLPLLRKYQPRIVDILGQTAEVMRNDETWLAEKAKEWTEGSAEKTNDGEIRIPLSSFIMLPNALKSRIIRHALRIASGDLRRIKFRHIKAIKQMAVGKKPQVCINLPHRISVRKVYERLIFSSAEEKKAGGFCYHFDGPGKFSLPALGRSITLEEVGQSALSDIGASPWTALLNADRLSYPLMIRNFRPGDKFIPIGMSGHKKLKELFIDLKVPSKVRAETPVLIYRNTPIWVCGLRIDDRFKVTPDTKKILKVTFDGN